MPKPVENMLKSDVIHGLAKGFLHLSKRFCAHFSHKGFDLGPHGLNGRKVRRIRRQVQQEHTRFFNAFRHGQYLVDSQVVQNQNFAWKHHRQQFLFQPTDKNGAIHGSLKNKWSQNAPQRDAREDRLANRRLQGFDALNALPFWPIPVGSAHVTPDPGFIEDDEQMPGRASKGGFEGLALGFMLELFGVATAFFLRVNPKRAIAR